MSRIWHVAGEGPIGGEDQLLTAAGRALIDDISADAQLTTLGVTAAGKALLDDANAAAQIATLGITATAVELNYVDGVASAIQPQFNTITSLLTPSKNLFDKSTVSHGFYVNSSSGNLGVNATYDASDWIPVLPSTQYIQTKDLYLAYYTAAKVFISGLATYNGNAIRTATTPALCFFMRVTVLPSWLDTYQVEAGASATIYAAYGYVLNISRIPSAPFVTNAMLNAGIVSRPNTDFVTIGKNLFDKLAITAGYYVNQNGGNLLSNASYNASDYIPITAGEQYSYYSSNDPTNLRIAFYNSAKVYISGLLYPSSPITAPALAAFVRFSLLTDSLNTAQFEHSPVRTAFEPYGIKLVNALYDNISNSVSNPASILLNLAPVIPAVVGHELNIYFSNIVSVDDINDFEFDVVSTKGIQQVERFTYIPVAGDVGDQAIRIDVYQKAIVVSSVSAIIRVSAVAKGTGQTLKVNIIGDSTTANNYMLDELVALFSADAMHITPIGTQGVTNLHEGWSGKTTTWIYADPASPFVSAGAFNYATYLSSHALATPDVVILNMGINDMFAFTDDASVLTAITTMIAQYDLMIANIKVSNANMKFGVCVTIPSGNGDAFGSSYGGGQTSWRYNRNNRLLANALIDYYKGKEAQYIFLVPININLDTVNNMALAAATPVNSRNPLTIARQTNGVHPGGYGYLQIADSDFYWLKSMVT